MPTCSNSSSGGREWQLHKCRMAQSLRRDGWVTAAGTRLGRRTCCRLASLSVVISVLKLCSCQQSPAQLQKLRHEPPQCPLRISLRRRFPSRAKVKSRRLRYTRNNTVPSFREVQTIRYYARKSNTAKQADLHSPSVPMTWTFPPPPCSARITGGNPNARETPFKRAGAFY